jgi:hypothetical protein
MNTCGYLHLGTSRKGPSLLSRVRRRVTDGPSDLDPSTAPMSPARAPPAIRRDSARGKRDMHANAAATPDHDDHDLCIPSQL